jgi:hypothetical protein
VETGFSNTYFDAALYDAHENTASEGEYARRECGIEGVTL